MVRNTIVISVSVGERKESLLVLVESVLEYCIIIYYCVTQLVRDGSLRPKKYSHISGRDTFRVSRVFAYIIKRYVEVELIS